MTFSERIKKHVTESNNKVKKELIDKNEEIINTIKLIKDQQNKLVEDQQIKLIEEIKKLIKDQ